MTAKEKFRPVKPSYTKKQAADYLSVSTRTIENFIARKLLRKCHVLARVVIPGEDVETFFDRTS